MAQTVWAGVQVHANDSNGTGVEPGAGTLPQELPFSSSFTSQFCLSGFTYPVKPFPQVVFFFFCFFPTLSHLQGIYLLEQRECLLKVIKTKIFNFFFLLMRNSIYYGHLVFILKAIKRKKGKVSEASVPAHNHIFSSLINQLQQALD